MVFVWCLIDRRTFSLDSRMKLGICGELFLFVADHMAAAKFPLRPHSLGGLTRELLARVTGLWTGCVCACAQTCDTCCNTVRVITGIIYPEVTRPMIAITLQHHLSLYWLCQ